MPLVDITYLRGYRLMRLDANSCSIDQTREAIFFYLGRAVPGLLVKHKEELGLDDDTSE